MSLEASILEIIRGKRRAPVLQALLKLLSYGYRFCIHARHLAYRFRLLSSSKLSATVISVGNITVGGTGKTPLVSLLANSIQLPTAILSRGYRSQMEKSNQMQCVSRGNGPLCSAADCGDEPFLLAQKTKASIWVGKKRVLSARKAISAGAQVLILDDGMQHLQMKRDIEIVVIDGQNPFAGHQFLPRGLLRDSPKRLKGADLIVANHVLDLAHYQKLQEKISCYTDAPLVGMQVGILDSPCAAKVGVFCGLGNPDRFIETVKDLKHDIVDVFFALDHHSVDEDTLQAFANRCKDRGAECLLCTEKDSVKLPSLHSYSLKIIPLKMELKIVAGEHHWKSLLEKVST